MVIHIVAYLLLTILPGAWIPFTLPLKGISFWIKLLIGIILSPIVVAAQFYLLRLAGIPFEPASIALVLINLPVLYWIYRAREPLPRFETQSLAAIGLFILVVLVAIAPFLLDPQKRIYTWEAWSQSDAVYGFASGQLDLREPEMVGFRLSYPWVGQVYQAVSSYVSDSPPMSNYIWGNLIWLVCIFSLAGAITAEISGNAFSQVTTAVWLAFAVNFVGAVIPALLPPGWVHLHRSLKFIWGDNRFTPWLDKIVFFGQVYFAMGIFIAILYLLLHRWPEESRKGYYTLIAILMAALCLIYPVLMPAGGIVVGILVSLALIRWLKTHSRADLAEFAVFASICLFSLLLTYVYTHFLTEARGVSSLFSIHDELAFKYRIAESLVVTSPLLVGLGVAFRRVKKVSGESLAILSLGFLGCMLLYIIFDIPWWHNEYKFVLIATICLAPILSLALEPFFQKIGKAAVPALALITVILAAPFIHDAYANMYSNYTRQGPAADVSGFTLRLANSEPLSGLIDTIRLKTPPDSLVLVGEASFYYPALTHRQLYAPPDQDQPYPGIEVTSEEMITLVNGLPASTLAERRSVLHQLYTGLNPASALESILYFQRPLALVIDTQKDAALLHWLDSVHLGQQIYNSNGYQLWLIQPDETPPQS